MAEKLQHFDRIMSKRDLSKFDTALLSDDGGKYSPSIRRLRQHYFHDTKSLPRKLFSSSIPSSTNSSSSKCEDCRKHDGFFQCCHCNQRLCIRCCHKHYKQVTNELDDLNIFSDHLLTKMVDHQIDLDKQKIQSIEQCQQWRVDTINKINKAHTLMIQTIQDEYEIFSKEYECFVAKEISQLNLIKTELFQMKKSNLGSLLSSPLSTTTQDSRILIDEIRERIETFVQQIDKRGEFSFRVKLPSLDIDENLRVESSFGNTTRSTSVVWHIDDFSTNTISFQSEEPAKTTSHEKDVGHVTASCSSTNPLPPPISRRHTYTFHQAISNQENDGMIARCRTTTSPFRSSSSSLSNECPSINY